MTMRDLLRYVAMLAVITLIDVSLYALWNWPLSPDSDIAFPALYVVLRAIREDKQ